MREHHPGHPSAPDGNRVPAVDRTRPLLCFVHSASDLDSAIDLVERIGDGRGALDMVQVRGKSLTAGDLERLVEIWVRNVAVRDTLVIVNDRLDVALATGADGVHVGVNDLPPDAIRRLAGDDFAIGVSAHDGRELLRAQQTGATYAGLGAFYVSRTKPEATVLDDPEANPAESLPAPGVPVLAIGGITAERVRDVFRVPAVTGIAVSEAIQGSDEPAAAVTRLRAAVDRAWEDRLLGAVHGHERDADGGAQ